MSELEEHLAGELRVLHRTRFIPELPVREHKFTDRKWRFDFAWPEYKLAVEVEGGTWAQGSHTRGARFAGDAAKYNEAALQGWTVLRFDNHMVLDGIASEMITRFFAARAETA